MDKHIDNVELYAACQSNDSQLKQAAYEILWNYLYQIAFYMVQDQPEIEALAQDCAQLALIRVHERLAECREPRAFRAWARRIVSRLVIDELRRRKRLVPLIEDSASTEPEEKAPSLPADQQPSLENIVLEATHQEALWALINQAPISDRSRRVVRGRYLDNLPDESLAQTESLLAKKTVLPSHIQVTRAKNIAKLKKWELLLSFLSNRDN